MNVYMLVSDCDHYEWFTPATAIGRGLLFFQTGNPIDIPDSLLPVPVVIGGNAEIESDFPSLYGCSPCISEFAWRSLRHLIEPNAQVVPVVRPDRTSFYAINVTNIIDCLKRDSSEININPIAEMVTAIYTYDFDMAKVGNSAIFKIPEMTGQEVYVTDVFKEAVEKHRLTGFEFNLIIEHGRPRRK